MLPDLVELDHGGEHGLDLVLLGLSIPEQDQALKLLAGVLGKRLIVDAQGLLNGRDLLFADRPLANVDRRAVLGRLECMVEGRFKLAGLYLELSGLASESLEERGRYAKVLGLVGDIDHLLHLLAGAADRSRHKLVGADRDRDLAGEINGTARHGRKDRVLGEVFVHVEELLCDLARRGAGQA
ncbi:hypothetical protein [Bradyrhizobium sp. CB2312]|uniref:hypothetical protein n=1 Tax=Bradyrhizobium sp. CB2312 TaxID=3039155 RepID=UPI0024B0E44F|nr:hypothetical protein [Bradyrhizobium sp. CB2312]WFU69436.1 hypothetical protein QA642_29655 [Bradyrhizobium sp. CB2312]